MYMGYLNGDLKNKTPKKGEKGEEGEKGVGFSLTADEHDHLKGKRLTTVSAPVDNHDTTTKKFVNDLLKNKAGTVFVNNELKKKANITDVKTSFGDKLEQSDLKVINNTLLVLNNLKADKFELTALNNKVDTLEATVGELQKALLLLKRWQSV